ncbi:MAG: SURF1 family protein [Methylobacterium mesophilicum]|nr:SURF1 family protein [Methylobacterium mesophilicum]
MTQPSAPRPHGIGALVLLGILAFLGIAALSALTVWQVERRAWKLDLIERVEARTRAEPTAPPGDADWAAGAPTDFEYRRARVSGRFLDKGEAQVQAVTERGGGFWVIAPFQTDDGRTILVNRGFVPADNRDPASHPPVEGETAVVGLLRLSEPGGAFLRANDPAADRWYSRDVGAIAASRSLGPVAPFFIDAEANANGAPPNARLPVGGLTVLRFNNNHLVYALTWLTLDIMLICATVFVARREWRLRRASRAP